jgi:hypothetical protein
MDSRTKTVVINLMDGRTAIYDLPPDRAVVAAFEEHDSLHFDQWTYASPGAIPSFKEYRRGYACGDWVAYKPI